MSICFDDSKNARESDLYLLALTGHYAVAICQGRSIRRWIRVWDGAHSFTPPLRMDGSAPQCVCPPGLHLEFTQAPALLA